MLENIKEKKKLLYAIMVSCIAVLWSQREIVVVSVSAVDRILELLFFVCIVLGLTWIIYYLIIEETYIPNKVFVKNYVKLLLVQTIAFLPLYTQNFMYGDDLWGFSSDFNGKLSIGLYFSRPFIDFLYGSLLDTSFLSIKYFRIYNGLILFLFGCVLFRYITIKTKDCNRAFVFSAVAIAGCSAVDCIAYASVFPINASMLLSAISFIIYQKAGEKVGHYKVIMLIESGICLFSAFCMYQIGTPIVFLMYVIAEKYSCIEKETKKFGKALVYLVYYGIVAIAYLATTSLLQMMAGVVSGQSARGEIITSIDLLVDKVVWFVLQVCPQALTRLIGYLFGNSLFVQNNMFYQCTYRQGALGVILIGVLVILMLVSIIATACGKRSSVYGFIAVVAIPLAFWPFLILPESFFLTYYGMAIILLFLWYVVDGIIILREVVIEKCGSFLKKIDGGIVAGIILIVIVMQSNNYAENSWVNYCRDSYEYLANTIAAELNDRENIDTIIVKGSLSPYVGGHDYVIFCVNDILTELGYAQEMYNVVQSDNGYYLTTFADEEMTQMERVLEEEEIERVRQYYVHDDLYGQWRYAGAILEQNEKEFLKACFEKVGLLQEEDGTSISINMDGFNRRHPF